MNATQRKQLIKIANKIYDLANEIDHLREELEEMNEIEQEKYDNMSEGAQESERGCRIYEGIDALEELCGRIDESVSELYDISNDVEHVTEI